MSQPTTATTSLDALAQRIRDGSCVVGIYGLGYVGLPLAIRFADVGIKVIGFDVDPVKVDKLNHNLSYIERIEPDTIARIREAGFDLEVFQPSPRQCVEHAITRGHSVFVGHKAPQEDR